MRKVVLASVVALLVGFSVGTTANAWPNFDILPDPNLEDLNDLPDLDSESDLDELRSWDFNNDGVLSEVERSVVFEHDMDVDGIPNYQDPDHAKPNYQLRLPGGYDYDKDSLYDDDPRDRVYGRDVPDPDPDPDPEMQYQYQETTVQEETAVAEEETTQEQTAAAEETTAKEEATPNPDDGIGPFWGGLLWLYDLAKGVVLVTLALTVVLGAVVAAIGGVAKIIGATGVTLLLMGAAVYVVFRLVT